MASSANPLLKVENIRWGLGKGLARRAKQTTPQYKDASESEILKSWSLALKLAGPEQDEFFRGLASTDPGLWQSPERAKQVIRKYLNPAFKRADIEAVERGDKKISELNIDPDFRPEGLDLTLYDDRDEEQIRSMLSPYKEKMFGTGATKAQGWAYSVITRIPGLEMVDPIDATMGFKEIAESPIEVQREIASALSNLRGYFSGKDPVDIIQEIRRNSNVPVLDAAQISQFRAMQGVPSPAKEKDPAKKMQDITEKTDTKSGDPNALLHAQLMKKNAQTVTDNITKMTSKGITNEVIMLRYKADQAWKKAGRPADRNFMDFLSAQDKARFASLEREHPQEVKMAIARQTEFNKAVAGLPDDVENKLRRELYSRAANPNRNIKDVLDQQLKNIATEVTKAKSTADLLAQQQELKDAILRKRTGVGASQGEGAEFERRYQNMKSRTPKPEDEPWYEKLRNAVVGFADSITPDSLTKGVEKSPWGGLVALIPAMGPIAVLARGHGFKTQDEFRAYQKAKSAYEQQEEAIEAQRKKTPAKISPAEETKRKQEAWEKALKKEISKSFFLEKAEKRFDQMEQVAARTSPEMAQRVAALKDKFSRLGNKEAAMLNMVVGLGSGGRLSETLDAITKSAEYNEQKVKELEQRYPGLQQYFDRLEQYKDQGKIKPIPGKQGGFRIVDASVSEDIDKFGPIARQYMQDPEVQQLLKDQDALAKSATEYEKLAQEYAKTIGSSTDVGDIDAALRTIDPSKIADLEKAVANQAKIEQASRVALQKQREEQRKTKTNHFALMFEGKQGVLDATWNTAMEYFADMALNQAEANLESSGSIWSAASAAIRSTISGDSAIPLLGQFINMWNDAGLKNAVDELREKGDIMKVSPTNRRLLIATINRDESDLVSGKSDIEKMIFNGVTGALGTAAFAAEFALSGGIVRGAAAGLKGIAGAAKLGGRLTTVSEKLLSGAKAIDKVKGTALEIKNGVVVTEIDDVANILVKTEAGRMLDVVQDARGLMRIVDPKTVAEMTTDALKRGVRNMGLAAGQTLIGSPARIVGGAYQRQTAPFRGKYEAVAFDKEGVPTIEMTDVEVGDLPTESWYASLGASAISAYIDNALEYSGAAILAGPKALGRKLFAKPLTKDILGNPIELAKAVGASPAIKSLSSTMYSHLLRKASWPEDLARSLQFQGFPEEAIEEIGSGVGNAVNEAAFSNNPSETLQTQLEATFSPTNLGAIAIAIGAYSLGGSALGAMKTMGNKGNLAQKAQQGSDLMFAARLQHLKESVAAIWSAKLGHGDFEVKIANGEAFAVDKEGNRIEGLSKKLTPLRDVQRTFKSGVVVGIDHNGNQVLTPEDTPYSLDTTGMMDELDAEIKGQVLNLIPEAASLEDLIDNEYRQILRQRAEKANVENIDEHIEKDQLLNNLLSTRTTTEEGKDTITLQENKKEAYRRKLEIINSANPQAAAVTLSAETSALEARLKQRAQEIASAKADVALDMNDLEASKKALIEYGIESKMAGRLVKSLKTIPDTIDALVSKIEDPELKEKIETEIVPKIQAKIGLTSNGTWHSESWQPMEASEITTQLPTLVEGQDYRKVEDPSSPTGVKYEKKVSKGNIFVNLATLYPGVKPGTQASTAMSATHEILHELLYQADPNIQNYLGELFENDFQTAQNVLGLEMMNYLEKNYGNKRGIQNADGAYEIGTFGKEAVAEFFNQVIGKETNSERIRTNIQKKLSGLGKVGDYIGTTAKFMYDLFDFMVFRAPVGADIEQRKIANSIVSNMLLTGFVSREQLPTLIEDTQTEINNLTQIAAKTQGPAATKAQTDLVRLNKRLAALKSSEEAWKGLRPSVEDVSGSLDFLEDRLAGGRYRGNYKAIADLNLEALAELRLRGYSKETTDGQARTIYEQLSAEDPDQSLARELLSKRHNLSVAAEPVTMTRMQKLRNFTVRAWNRLSQDEKVAYADMVQKEIPSANVDRMVASGIRIDVAGLIDAILNPQKQKAEGEDTTAEAQETIDAMRWSDALFGESDSYTLPQGTKLEDEIILSESDEAANMPKGITYADVAQLPGHSYDERTNTIKRGKVSFVNVKTGSDLEALAPIVKENFVRAKSFIIMSDGKKLYWVGTIMGKNGFADPETVFIFNTRYDGTGRQVNMNYNKNIVTNLRPFEAPQLKQIEALTTKFKTAEEYDRAYLEEVADRVMSEFGNSAVSVSTLKKRYGWDTNKAKEIAIVILERIDKMQAPVLGNTDLVAMEVADEQNAVAVINQMRTEAGDKQITPEAIQEQHLATPRTAQTVAAAATMTEPSQAPKVTKRKKTAKKKTDPMQLSLFNLGHTEEEVASMTPEQAQQVVETRTQGPAKRRRKPRAIEAVPAELFKGEKKFTNRIDYSYQGKQFTFEFTEDVDRVLFDIALYPNSPIAKQGEEWLVSLGRTPAMVVAAATSLKERIDTLAEVNEPNIYIIPKVFATRVGEAEGAMDPVQLRIIEYFASNDKGQGVNVDDLYALDVHPYDLDDMIDRGVFAMREDGTVIIVPRKGAVKMAAEAEKVPEIKKATSRAKKKTPEVAALAVKTEAKKKATPKLDELQSMFDDITTIEMNILDGTLLDDLALQSALADNPTLSTVLRALAYTAKHTGDLEEASRRMLIEIGKQTPLSTDVLDRAINVLAPLEQNYTFAVSRREGIADAQKEYEAAKQGVIEAFKDIPHSKEILHTYRGYDLTEVKKVDDVYDLTLVNEAGPIEVSVLATPESFIELDSIAEAGPSNVRKIVELEGKPFVRMTRNPFGDGYLVSYRQRNREVFVDAGDSLVSLRQSLRNKDILNSIFDDTVFAEVSSVVPDLNERGELVAPNRTVSRLTPWQWRVAKTDRFKTWAAAKAVLEPNGEPAVVYEIGAGRFTPSIELANRYAKETGKLLPRFLKSEKVFDPASREGIDIFNRWVEKLVDQQKLLRRVTNRAQEFNFRQSIAQSFGTASGYTPDFLSQLALEGYDSYIALEGSAKVYNVVPNKRTVDTFVVSAGFADSPTAPLYSAIDWMPEAELRNSPLEVDTMLATAVKQIRTVPEEEINIADLNAARMAPVYYQKIVDLVSSYTGIVGDNLDDTAEKNVEFFKDNLLFMYDAAMAVDPEVYGNRAVLWYSGANRIANDIAQVYGMPVEAAGAIIALFSPSTEWFQNVQIARNFIQIMNSQDKTWDSSLAGTMKARVEQAKKDLLDPEKKNKAAKALAFYKVIKGKNYSDITNAMEKAYWIDLFMRSKMTSYHHTITPEGDTLDLVRGKSGKLKSGFYPSRGTIAAAISVIENPTLSNIRQRLGEGHKIRNFYNNIISPSSTNPFVTIDTHAVGAAHIEAFSQEAPEVKSNFGAPATKTYGFRGTYPLYAEAYIRAARERGRLPREMQSITWEAIRTLFPTTAKKATLEYTRSVWDKVRKGELTNAEARETILGNGGGIKVPSWAGSSVGSDIRQRSSSESEFVGLDGVWKDVRGAKRRGTRIDTDTAFRGAGELASAVEFTPVNTIGIADLDTLETAYKEAIAANDKERIKEIVLQAARVAGFDSPVLFNDSDNETNTSVMTDGPLGTGHYTVVATEGTDRPRFVARLGNTLDFSAVAPDFAGTTASVYSALGVAESSDSATIRQAAVDSGLDSITIRNAAGRKAHILYAGPQQIRSIAPVVYDYSGQVMSLSDRFDTTNDTFLYSAPDFNYENDPITGKPSSILGTRTVRRSGQETLENARTRAAIESLVNTALSSGWFSTARNWDETDLSKSLTPEEIDWLVVARRVSDLLGEDQTELKALGVPASVIQAIEDFKQVVPVLTEEEFDSFVESNWTRIINAFMNYSNGIVSETEFKDIVNKAFEDINVNIRLTEKDVRDNKATMLSYVNSLLDQNQKDAISMSAYIGGGSQSRVYKSKDGENVYKVIGSGSASFRDGQRLRIVFVDNFFYAAKTILDQDKLPGLTPSDIVGFVKNRGFIVKQPMAQNTLTSSLTKQEVDKHLRKAGFIPMPKAQKEALSGVIQDAIKGSYIIRADKDYIISDVRWNNMGTGNVRKDQNGIHIIDVAIHTLPKNFATFSRPLTNLLEGKQQLKELPKLPELTVERVIDKTRSVVRDANGKRFILDKEPSPLVTEAETVYKILGIPLANAQYYKLRSKKVRLVEYEDFSMRYMIETAPQTRLNYIADLLLNNEPGRADSVKFYMNNEGRVVMTDPQVGFLRGLVNDSWFSSRLPYTGLTEGQKQIQLSQLLDKWADLVAAMPEDMRDELDTRIAAVLNMMKEQVPGQNIRELIDIAKERNYYFISKTDTSLVYEDMTGAAYRVDLAPNFDFENEEDMKQLRVALETQAIANNIPQTREDVEALARMAAYDQFEYDNDGNVILPSRKVQELPVYPAENLSSMPDLSQKTFDFNEDISVLTQEAIDDLEEIRWAKNNISTQLKTKGSTNVLGKRVRSISDLAAIAQVFRDPRFETLRVLLADSRGNVLETIGISQRLPYTAHFSFGSTPSYSSLVKAIGEEAAKEVVGNALDNGREVLLGQIAERMEALGATKYYLVHNHPNGSPTPSPEDIGLSRYLDSELDGFSGHVVVDTNKYGVITRESFTIPDYRVYIRYNVRKNEEGVVSYVPVYATIDQDAVEDTVSFATVEEAEAYMDDRNKLLVREEDFGQVDLYRAGEVTELPAEALIADYLHRNGPTNSFVVITLDQEDYTGVGGIGTPYAGITSVVEIDRDLLNTPEALRNAIDLVRNKTLAGTLVLGNVRNEDLRDGYVNDVLSDLLVDGSISYAISENNVVHQGNLSVVPPSEIEVESLFELPETFDIKDPLPPSYYTTLGDYSATILQAAAMKPDITPEQALRYAIPDFDAYPANIQAELRQDVENKLRSDGTSLEQLTSLPDVKEATQMQKDAALGKPVDMQEYEKIDTNQPVDAIAAPIPGEVDHSALFSLPYLNGIFTQDHFIRGWFEWTYERARLLKGKDTEFAQRIREWKFKKAMTYFDHMYAMKKMLAMFAQIRPDLIDPVYSAMRKGDRLGPEAALYEMLDPYLQEELMTGRAGEQLKDFTREMERDIFDFARQNNISEEELHDLMYAMHAIERNYAIAQRNTNFGDIIWETDAQGNYVTKNGVPVRLGSVFRKGMEEGQGSGITNREALEGFKKATPGGTTAKGLLELFRSVTVQIKDIQTGIVRSQKINSYNDITLSPTEILQNVTVADPVNQPLFELATRVFSKLQANREFLVEGDLITNEVKDAWESAYKYYIPLRHLEMGTSDTVVTGTRLSVKGPESKFALGRLSRTENSLAFIMSQIEHSIVRVNKNKVGQSLGRFLQSLSIEKNPNESIQAYVQRLSWDSAGTVPLKNRKGEVYGYQSTIKFRQTRKTKYLDPDTQKTMSKTEVQDVPLFEVNTRKFKPALNANGMVQYRHDFYESKKNTLTYKENGQEVNLTINYPALLASMNHMASRSAKDYLDPTGFGNTVGLFGKMMRGLGQLYTSWSLTFMMYNPQRDVMNAALNAFAEYQGISEEQWEEFKRKGLVAPDAKRFSSTKLAGKIWSKSGPLGTGPVMPFGTLFGRAAKAIRHAIRLEKGKLTATTVQTPTGPTTIYEGLSEEDAKWLNYYNEMKETGGLVSFYSAQTYEDLVMSIQKGFSDKNEVKKAMKGWLDVIPDVNRVLENSTRIAAYVAAREMGMSKERAASLAKNVTVNFNRKGLYDTKMATFLKEGYLFFNASLQGIARMAQVMSRNPLSVLTKSLGPVTMFSALMSMLNRALGGEDEDERDVWDHYDSTQKMRNLFVLMGDDRAFAIKIPYGWNILFMLGTALESSAQYHLTDGKKGQHPTLNALDVFATFNSYLDIAGTGFDPTSKDADALRDMALAFVPSLARPLVHVWNNRNYAGATIRPEIRNDEIPAAYVTYGNAGWLAETLASMNPAKNIPFFSTSPDSIKYLIDSYGGGLVRFIREVVDMVGKAGKAGDDPWEYILNNMPIVKAALPKHRDRFTTELFNEYSNKLEASENYLKRLESDANVLRKSAAQARSAGDMELAKQYEEEAKALREKRNQIKKDYLDYFRLAKVFRRVEAKVNESRKKVKIMRDSPTITEKQIEEEENRRREMMLDIVKRMDAAMREKKLPPIGDPIFGIDV